MHTSNIKVACFKREAGSIQCMTKGFKKKEQKSYTVAHKQTILMAHIEDLSE